MSRYIDADAFIARVEKEAVTPRERINALIIKSAVAEQPTAYDVEKVVAELGEASHWEEPTFDEDGYCNYDSWEVVYTDKAIDMVKRGGVE